MENYDQVGKFENIAENSEGSTKEKMDIYGDSVEASKNRRTAAVEEFTQNFSILGADGAEILTKWNDLLTHILKNWKKIIGFIATVTILSKGLLSGSMFGGLAKLMQSLTVSAGSFAGTMQTMGANLPGKLGRFARWSQGKSAGSGTKTYTGWRANAHNQIQEGQSAKIYSAAMKAGQAGGMDAIQADRQASFLSNLDSKQLKALEALTPEQQQKLIQTYGEQDPVVDSQNQLIAALNRLKASIDKLSGEETATTVVDPENTGPVLTTTDDFQYDLYGNEMMSHEEAKRLSEAENAKRQKMFEEERQQKLKTANETADIEKAGEAEGANIDKAGESAGAQTELTAEKLAAALEIDAAKAKQIIESGIIGPGAKISGIRATDASGIVYMAGQKPVQNSIKNKASSGLGSAAAGAGAMAATMGLGMLTANTVDQEDTGEQIAGTVGTMAPMIGMMFGPWGALIGTVVGLISSLITLKKTEAEKRQEILDNAKEAKEKLSKFTDKIDKNTQENQELENLETRFNELIKGVDINTQSNISLNSTEWEEYQSILSKIIDSSKDLYKAYDDQGNIVAKSSKGISNLSDILSQATAENAEEIRKNAERYTNSPAQQLKLVEEAVLKAKEESSLPDDGSYDGSDWGLDWDDFYLTSENAGTINGEKQKGNYNFWKSGLLGIVRKVSRGESGALNPVNWFFSGEDSRKIQGAVALAMADGASGLSSDINGLGNLISNLIAGTKTTFMKDSDRYGADDTKDNIKAFIKASQEAGYTFEQQVQGLLDMNIKHGYFGEALTEEEAEQIVQSELNVLNNRESVWAKTSEAYADSLGQGMAIALQSSELYVNLSDESKTYLGNLVKNIDIDLYKKNSSGEYVVDSKTGERTEKSSTEKQQDIERYNEAAQDLVKWVSANQGQTQKYIIDFKEDTASSIDWEAREGLIKDMVEYISQFDTDNDGKNDTTDYNVQLSYLQKYGYTVDEKNIHRDKDGNIIGFVDDGAFETDKDGNIVTDKNGQKVLKTYKTTATKNQINQYEKWAKEQGITADSNNDGNIDETDIIFAQTQHGYVDSTNVFTSDTTKNGKTVDTVGIMDVAQDQREVLWNDVNFADTRKQLEDAEFNLSDFDYSTMRLLYESKNDSGLQNLLENGAEKKEILTYLQEQKLGTDSSTSDYYSLLISEMEKQGLNTSSIDHIKANLTNDNIKSTYAFKQLEQMAKSLNVEMEYLIENMDLFGSIDPFFRTNKSLTEMESTFDNLYNIIDDIREDGKLTAEHLQMALETYPDELLPLINDAEAFANKVQDLYSNKSVLMAAPIKTALDQNTKIYIDGIDEISDLLEGQGTISLDERSKQILSSFGTVENISKITDNYEKYGVDENGNEKDAYFTFGFGGDAHTFEKDLMDTFGVDRTKGYSAAREGLEEKIRPLFVSAGFTGADSMSYQDMLGQWKSIVVNGNTGLISDYLNAQNHLKSLQASYTILEDEIKEKAIDKAHGDLSSNYNMGKTSFDDYISGLERYASAAKKGSEQQKKLNQEIAEAKFDHFTSEFEEGIITLEEYSSELKNLISLVVVGSEAWTKYIDAAKKVYDTKNQNLDNEMQMLEDDDYSGMLSIWDQKIENDYKKLSIIEAEGLAKAQQSGETYDKYQDTEWLQQREQIRANMESKTGVYDEMYDSYVNDYNIGNIGLEELINRIADLRKESDLTKEQVEKLREAEEEYRLELSKRNYQDGKSTGDEYRADLMLDVRKNVSGSEEERESLDAMLDSYDSDISKINSKINLLDEHDYSAKAVLLEQSLGSINSKLTLMEAMGLKGSQQWLDTLAEGAKIQEQILENQKASLEYQIEQSKIVLDAYSSLIDFGLDELQKRQQDINDMYDDEISKLQDINDQKKRSIELTKLQQELENARKEKTRVYVAGVGWTYQENKAKVKEAKRNLESYLDEQKISDLQNAQKQQNTLIQDQIDKLQDIKDYISDVQKASSATASLQDLIYRGIIPEGSTLQSAIQTINNGVINGPDGKIQQLDTHFEAYSKIFTDKSSELNILMDSYDANLKAISAYWSESYASPIDMVNALKEKIADKIVGSEGTSLYSIEQKINTFLDNHTYADWVNDIKTSISNVASSMSGQTLKIDDSGLKTALAEAQKAVNAAETALRNLDGTLGSSKFSGFNGTIRKFGDEQYASVVKKRIIGNVTYIYDSTEGVWYKATRGGNHGGYVVSDGSMGMSDTDFRATMGYSSGIENGPITYTGLAMLHGSPSNPEYVLNSDQAGTLLKNLATMTLSPYQAPKVDSYNHSASSTVYQFNGDLNLPNVQRPDQFFSELLKQASVQFPTIKNNYSNKF